MGIWKSPKFSWHVLPVLISFPILAANGERTKFLYQENFRVCDILKNHEIHSLKAVNNFPVSEKQREVENREVRIQIL